MRRLQVLLVDDEEVILRALAAELADVAEITTATSVAAALEHLGRRSFDVVVADLRLPDRWGDEVLAHVAARSPSTRRFLLTADLDPQRTVRELLDSRVIQAAYQKPHTEELLETIRDLAR